MYYKEPTVLIFYKQKRSMPNYGKYTVLNRAAQRQKVLGTNLVELKSWTVSDLKLTDVKRSLPFAQW